MPWIGRKKIAFVPLSRTNAHPPDFIPSDWESDILRRALYDPNPTTGKDESLRAYVGSASKLANSQKRLRRLVESVFGHSRWPTGRDRECGQSGKRHGQEGGHERTNHRER